MHAFEYNTYMYIQALHIALHLCLMQATVNDCKMVYVCTFCRSCMFLEMHEINFLSAGTLPIESLMRKEE